MLILQIDAPMLTSEWTKPGMLSHFTVVRKLEGGIFPMGFTKEAAERNTKAGSNVISFESRQVHWIINVLPVPISVFHLTYLMLLYLKSVKGHY